MGSTRRLRSMRFISTRSSSGKCSQPNSTSSLNVVRTADGRIQLIVHYGGWFGWIGWWQRPVAVPIEAVALLGRHVALLDIAVEELRRAPTWRMSGESREIDPAQAIRIAITRR